jgi:hypothetical protein
MEFDPLSFIHWVTPAIAAGGVIVYFVRKRLHVARGRSWPALSGSIAGSLRKNVGHSKALEITYTYWVDGHIYSGQCDRMLKRSYEAAETVICQDCPILIRYDPMNPDRSVIFDEDQSQDFRHLVR